MVKIYRKWDAKLSFSDKMILFILQVFEAIQRKPITPLVVWLNHLVVLSINHSPLR